MDCHQWQESCPLVCGTRYSLRKYAKLRLQRDQGGNLLYITCLNQKEISDGDLIIISEKEIKSKAKNVASKPHP